jgi:hypothetical protein
LHKIKGDTSREDGVNTPPNGAVDAQRADADALHAVYSALLALLPLSRAHRENLQKRGFPDAEIDKRLYRTLRVEGRARLAEKLKERFGDSLLRIPGFVLKHGENGPYLTLAGAAGLLIPVRDASARIIALKIRRGEDDHGKYQYLSSIKYGGPGPGAPVHVPLGVGCPCSALRVSEGELKGDLATVLSGFPTISIPGATTWRRVLPVLKDLGVHTVRIALDRDATENTNVAHALLEFANTLTKEGYGIEMERWPAEHKGIDDALAAGVAIDVLSGGEVDQAIADTVAEAAIDEPFQESATLERLVEVLAEGGAVAVFRNTALLNALADLAEENPAEFAVCRARLSGAGVKLRDLDHALAPLRREIRAAKPRPDAVGQYSVSAGRIVRSTLTDNGPSEVVLANWAGRIVEEIVLDDGAGRQVHFAIEGALADGIPLPRVEVTADEFPFMRWPVAKWGARAVVLAGMGTADHLRVALQLLSGDIPRRVVFGHTGWREIDGRWVFLHAGGALGAPGPVGGIETSLPIELHRLVLPNPPQGKDLVRAIRASLGLVGLGPDKVIFPGLGAVYRVVLGGADFSTFFPGPSGTFKTEWTALLQQHFGAGFDARNLPASWASTSNFLEALAFAAMDVILVVDDFKPAGSATDIQRLHRDADRLFRGQGNHAGRQRMRADGSLRPTKFPRGIIVSSGEDIPKGESLRARLLIQEISKGDFGPQPPTPNAPLTACQTDAAAGLYAQCVAAFIVSLAPRYAEVRANITKEQARLRSKFATDGQHARTPGIAAALALGLQYFLAFAVEKGAIAKDEAKDLWERGLKALQDAAADQTTSLGDAEPTNHFLRLLRAVLASGRGHVANSDGTKPENASAWGWRQIENGTEARWQAQGKRIGWVVDNHVYLELEAAFAEVQELAHSQGDNLAIAPRTLMSRLHEKGLLGAMERHGGKTRLTVRRTLEGQRREVISLRADSLYPPDSAPSAPISPNGRENKGFSWRTPPESAPPSPSECANWRTSEGTVPSVNGQKHGQSDDLAHLAHSETGEDTTSGKNKNHQQAGDWEVLE